MHLADDEPMISEDLTPEELPDFQEPNPVPEWKVYENAIAHIEESAGDGAKVNRNHKIMGQSETQRQVDVWLERTVGAGHLIKVAIECKCYNTREVTIQEIDSFVGFLEDIQADKGVMLSHSGFSDAAKRRAEVANIELQTLTLEEAEEFDWDEYTADSCESLGECFGRISWHFSNNGSEAGYCDSCGLFHIRCGECGWISFYDEDRIVQCSGCEMRWELSSSDGMTDGIKELPPTEEEQDDSESEE